MTPTLAKLLRTAHAFEHKFVERVKEYLDTSGQPNVQLRLKDHLVEMQWQIKLLEACLEFQEGKNDPPCEETCRRAMQSGEEGLIAIKRFKIDFYKKLLLMARKHNAAEVLQASREILGQERAMAEWLEDYYQKA